jgi:cell division protein FtsX
VHTDYKSKETLLEELKQKDPKLVWILEDENPLPNTILISNIWLNEYVLLNDNIEKKIYMLDNWNKLEQKENFTDYKAQYKRIIKVIAVLNILRVGLYVIIGIFLLSISVIVYSIIGNFIYYYRDEIYITKLVWWDNFFIHWPFVFQWMIYTFLSFIGSATIFLILLNNLGFIFSLDHSFDFISNYFNLILLFELIIFILIWALSWYFSSKKYINN